MLWLKKILNNWYIKVVLLCFVSLIYTGGWCEIKHPLNPNLKLVVGDTTAIFDSLHCSYPVVSPDGKKVYYLCVNTDSTYGFYELPVGDIWAVNVDGSNNRLLLDGVYHLLSISHDGSRLAFQSCRGSYNDPVPESLILIVHLRESTIANIESLWVTQKGINKIEWSSDDEYLYYQSLNFIYRLQLSNGVEELVTSIPGIKGFDLFKDNTIYYDSVIKNPQINPIHQNYVIGTKYEFSGSLLIRNISQGTLSELPASCEPYGISGLIGYPYWFPDGNTIVFAATPYVEGTHAPAEIWILENFFEQIK